MRIAAVVPYWLDRPATEAVDIVLNAEATGVGEAWMGEMLSFDAFGLAGALAAQTSEITITVGPLPVAVRTPVNIAMGFAGLQNLAGPDRVRLALGSSTRPVVQNWHGQDWSALRSRMGKTVDVLQQIWDGEKTQHELSRGFRLGIPTAKPHLTIAAFGPQMIQTAAQQADRVVLNLVTADQVAKLRERLDTLGATHVEIAVWVAASLDPTDADRSQRNRQVSLYVAAPGYGEMFADAGFSDAVQAARAAEPFDVNALADSVAPIGDESALRSAFDDYFLAGADQVAVVPITASDPGAKRLLDRLGTWFPASAQ